MADFPKSLPDQIISQSDEALVEELKRAMCCPNYNGKCYAEMSNVSCAARSYDQRARAILPIICREQAALSAQLTEAKADAERLAGALEWYRVQAEGCRKLGQHGEIYRNALDRDGGQCARTALGDK